MSLQFPRNDAVTRMPNHAGTVFNAAVDQTEYIARGMGDNSAITANLCKVHQNDLVFQRVGAKPVAMQKEGLIEDHVAVFATFNGISHHKESDFNFMGVARNDAEHQDRNGPLGKQFAVYYDGAVTIICRSQLDIRKGARVAFRIPRGVSVATDQASEGRLLVELYEFTTDKIKLAETMHQLVASTQYGVPIKEEDRETATLMTSMYEHVLSIALTGVYALKEAETGTALSAAEKIRLAQIVGIVGTQGQNQQAAAATKAIHDKFQHTFLNALFQKTFDPATKVSQSSVAARSFQLQTRTLGQPTDQRGAIIAQKQANQVQKLFDLFIRDYDAKMATVIGWAPNGGTPNQWFDVQLRRQ